MASKPSKNQRPASRGGEAPTWWQARGWRRVRVLRGARKSVLVWQDESGREVRP